ncbi:hypothetical protein ACFL0M_16285, partial [Thermodesulfobacteriota bacterium]
EKILSAYENKRTSRRFKRKFEKINFGLMELGRILIPIFSSGAGKYGHDLWGTRLKPVPKLQPLKNLNLMDKNSDEFKAMRTTLLINRNRVSDVLNSGNRFLDGILAAI